MVNDLPGTRTIDELVVALNISPEKVRERLAVLQSKGLVWEPREGHYAFIRDNL